MRLFTLLAGYAAGLAVAMKVRRDAGTSKLDSTDPSKTTLDKLVDEVKDIHESTYKDVKAYVSTHFSDVHDFETLKSKVASIVDNVANEADAFLSSLMEKWDTKKDDIEGKVDEFFSEKEAILEEAKNKWISLADTTADTVVSWIEVAKKKLLELRENMKSKIQEEAVDVSTELEKKPTAKRAPAKKPATKKPQA
jgi:hypothetical protein